MNLVAYISAFQIAFNIDIFTRLTPYCYELNTAHLNIHRMSSFIHPLDYLTGEGGNCEKLFNLLIPKIIQKKARREVMREKEREKIEHFSG